MPQSIEIKQHNYLREKNEQQTNEQQQQSDKKFMIMKRDGEEKQRKY